MSHDAETERLIKAPRLHEIQGPLDIVPTIPNVIRRAREKFGDLTFLLEGERAISFAEADRQSAELARGLLAMGAGKGARIAIMMPNCADWVLGFLAATRIGAIVVGFSTLYQRREIDWALRHNDIDTLLVSAKFGNANYQERLEQAVPDLAKQSSDRPFYLASHPYLRRIVVWGDDVRPWALKGPDAILARAAGAPQIDEAFLRAVESNVTPADEMVIICTSGTTAEPKAVLHTHGGGLRNTWNFTPYTFFEKGERIYCGLPYFWVGGLLRGVMPSLYAGACSVFPALLSGDDLVSMIVDKRVTNVFVNGAQSHALRTAAAKRGADLSFVRYGVGPMRDLETGQPIPADRRIGGVMGMTESFGTHSGEAYNLPTPRGKADNWGRGAPDVERRIVSFETGEVLPAGQIGELQLRGPSIMRGYYKRERHEAFTPDWFFRTGDRCMIDEDDYIFFYGRANEMIKTAGANVAPLEVEAVLVSFPEVREAIVFGVPDEARGEAVVAVIVPEDGATIDAAQLRQRVRSELSSYKAPQIIVPMAYEAVPRTDALGKPRKVVLREMVVAEREKAPDFGQ